MNRFDSVLLIPNPNSAQGPFLIKTSDFPFHSVSDGKSMEVDKMETGGPNTSAEGEKMETDEQTAGPSSSKIDEGKYDWTQNIKPHTRIAVIGEDGCGKTTLIKAIKNENSVPPGVKYASMRHYLEIQVDGETEKCMVGEINNWEKIVERKEKLDPSLHVALMCFNKSQEYENLKKWGEELEKGGLPVIWVKIKKEPGKDNDIGTIESQHIVCCPPAVEGVRYVFEQAVREARRKQSRDKK